MWYFTQIRLKALVTLETGGRTIHKGSFFLVQPEVAVQLLHDQLARKAPTPESVARSAEISAADLAMNAAMEALQCPTPEV